MNQSSLKLSLQNIIKPYSKCILNLSQQELRTILKDCIQFIENNNCSKEVHELELSRINNASENYNEIFTALYMLLTTIFKHKKGGDIELVLKDLKFSPGCTEDLVKFIENQKEPLSKRYFELKLKQSSINRYNYQYRINMGPSSQFFITLQLQYKGALKSVQLSLRQFQLLRLVVAKLLSEMQLLEK